MTEIIKSQHKLYLGKYKKYGDDSRSVSWNDTESQFLRFENISVLFKNEKKGFSVHEVGCGLAHFKDFLDSRKIDATYSGNDIVAEFIEKNRDRFPDCIFVRESITDKNIDKSIRDKDYYCLSGTFHTKEDNSVQEWEKFVFESIKVMFSMAKKGIAFNFLTKHSDYYDERLYYADPSMILKWCVQNLSRFVKISHDMPLYEFTVMVYKREYMKSIYPNYEKYFAK